TRRDVCFQIVGLPSGRGRPTPFLPEPGVALAFSPDGRTLAAVDAAGTILVFDTANSRKERFRLPPGRTGKARCLALSAGGGLLAGGEDGPVRLWDGRSGAPLRVFKGHRGPVNAVAAAPDGRALASAGQEGKVLLWDAGECQERQALAGQVRPGRLALSA